MAQVLLVSGIRTISDALYFRIGWGRVGRDKGEAQKVESKNNPLMVGPGRRVVNRHHHYRERRSVRDEAASLV